MNQDGPDFLLAVNRLKEALAVDKDQQVAEVLGLSAAAFSDRKRRGAFPTDKLFALVAKRPDLGIDVGYVLSGVKARGAAAAENARDLATLSAQAETLLEPNRAKLLASIVAGSITRKTQAGAARKADYEQLLLSLDSLDEPRFRLAVQVINQLVQAACAEFTGRPVRRTPGAGK